MKPVRLVVVLMLTALAVWLGRLMAHSKVPHPEGRWREIGPEELRSTT